MNHATEELSLIDFPSFLNADFAMIYTGKSLPFFGLMAGDLVCLRAASQVDGCLTAVQDGENTLLGRLLHIDKGVALVPLDAACPARIFVEGKDDPPHVVGEVTGWIHIVPQKNCTSVDFATAEEGGLFHGDAI